MKKVTLSIGGMSCSACSSGLEKYLNKQEGVKASVNLVMSTATIEYVDNLKIKDLERYIKSAGFKSLGKYDPKKEDKSNLSKTILIVFGILLIILMFISMIHLPIKPFYNGLISFIITIFFLIYGHDILYQGYKNLIHKTPNMDTLVSIGVLASFIYSIVNLFTKNYDMLYFEASSMSIYFIKLGRYLENINIKKTKSALKDLVTITPENALRKRYNKEELVEISDIKKNDILIVKPGMKVACDGVIINGSGHFDESFITGESKPYEKEIGDEVLAGSISIDGYTEYQAKRIGKDSTISNIVHMVEASSNSKPEIAYLADKICSYFVPLIMIISILALIIKLILGFSFNEAIITFVSVLVVACPCGLGLASPLAVVVSSGKCAKKGIFIRSSKVFEKLNKIDTVIFDKTGTLTYGNLKISKVFNYSKYSNEKLINIVFLLEEKSSHPIALAFKDYFRNKDIKVKEVKDFKNISGEGISGKIGGHNYLVGSNKLVKDNNHIKDEKELLLNGSSIIYVKEDDNVIGLIGVNDLVRINARKVITNLKKSGKEVILLSGDNKESAMKVGMLLGIEKIEASKSPLEKINYIKEKQKTKHVLMVGDGINDAPALTRADVSISMKSGTDVAMNSSDVILMNNNLENIIDLFKISKKTIINIKENLFWAFIYNIIMIQLALGLFKVKLNPMYGSLCMMLSSLTVVLNALRLRKE